jgi:DNA glycosylase AlkZ-like
VTVELTWPQVHAFRLGRQHLNGVLPGGAIAPVVGDMVAAQAQLMSAAELQIAVRAGCGVSDVRRALWVDRTLIKTWLMRGTLHLARAEDLALFTAAMSRRWIKPSKSWLRFFGVGESELWELADEIGRVLGAEPMTREQLIGAAGARRPARIRQALKSGWGGMLKPAARNGLLCFGPSRGQSVTFVRPRDWLAGWREVDPDTALTEVARRYLRVYGPATRTDFARWWGTWPGVGRAAWSGLAQELVRVSVEGQELEALAGDIEEMRSADIDVHVQLLPLFDPYLLGHENRDHLFERAHASKVSRTAGWISATVLVDGSVAGTWTHTLVKRSLRIAVSPFGPLKRTVIAGIRTRAEGIARALGAAALAVEIS